MGKVAMKLKISTEGPHVDMEKLKQEVQELTDLLRKTELEDE